MRIGLLCGLAGPLTASVVDALAEGGFRTLASSGLGMTLARAGRIVEPLEMLTREPAVHAGRVEGLHPRVALALATRWAQPREREAAQSKVAGPIDVLICNLPQSPRDLECSTQRECRDAISSGPWVAQAALLDLALVNHREVLTLVAGQDAAQHIRALCHDMCSAELRAELAGRAYAHLQGYRALQAWAFGWQQPAPTHAAGAGNVDAALRPSGDHALHATGGHQPGESGAAAVVTPETAADATARVSRGIEPATTTTQRPTSVATELDAPAVHRPTSIVEVVDDAKGLAPIESDETRGDDGGWPALPQAGRARIEVPPSFGAHWVVDQAGQETAATRATLHAALETLAVVDGPVVILAHGGATSVVVRILSTSTRAILRALATDPRALDNGVLVVRGDIDLTAQRVLNDSPGVERLALIALDLCDEQIRSSLMTVPERAVVGVRRVADGATHTLSIDADGIWLAPRSETTSRATIESATQAHAPDVLAVPGAVEAVELGLALLAGLQGSGAVAVNGEMALSICGGQAHATDALQIVAAKARKQAAKAMLVADAGPVDAQLLQGLKAAGFAALFLVPRHDQAPATTIAGSLPLVVLPSR